MYEIYTENKKVERRLREIIILRNDVQSKLFRLKINPRKESGAHPLQGRLAGKWSCWLGSNLRMVYLIDDTNMKIMIQSIGSHKIY